MGTIHCTRIRSACEVKLTVKMATKNEIYKPINHINQSINHQSIDQSINQPVNTYIHKKKEKKKLHPRFLRVVKLYKNERSEYSQRRMKEAGVESGVGKKASFLLFACSVTPFWMGKVRLEITRETAPNMQQQQRWALPGSAPPGSPALSNHRGEMRILKNGLRIFAA